MDLYTRIYEGVHPPFFIGRPAFEQRNGTNDIFPTGAKLMHEMKRRYIIKQRPLFRKAGARKFLTSPSTARAFLPRLRRDCPQKSRIKYIAVEARPAPRNVADTRNLHFK